MPFGRVGIVPLDERLNSMSLSAKFPAFRKAVIQKLLDAKYKQISRSSPSVLRVNEELLKS